MSSRNDGRARADVRLRYLLMAMLLLGGLVNTVGKAWADISFTVLNPDRLTSAGGSETFLGTITNNTDADLPANELFLDFSGFDPTHLAISDLLSTANFDIKKGDTSPVLELFRANLAADIKPGVYPIDVLLQSQDGDIGGPQTATLRVVPEPSRWIIMSFGLFVVLSLGALRRVAAGKQKLSTRLRR